MHAFVAAGLPLEEHLGGATAAGQATEAAVSGEGKGHAKDKGQGKSQGQKLAAHVLRWALAWEVELDEGNEVEDLGARGNLDCACMEMPGCDRVILESYAAFVRGLVLGPIANVQELVEAPGTLEVRLGEVVLQVNWEAEDGARVQMHGGSTHWARRVVVTLPLGVLKEGTVTFRPPLPSWKADAINCLGCAAMAKVFLRFPKRFWNWKDSASGWSICGTGANRDAVPEALFECSWFFPYPLPEGALPDDEGVLCVLLKGSAARAVQTMKDEDVEAAAMAALNRAVTCQGTKRFFIKGGLQNPTAIHVSRWLADPFARCSWTAFIPGSFMSDCATLSRPLGEGNCLRFAGEHTALMEMATVHGAWLTGLREAEGVLMESLSEGCFAEPEAIARAAGWMLYCREALARARVMEEANVSDSESSSSDSD